MADVTSLNTEQAAVYEACVNGNESIFCTGQGGTGKSFLLSLIVSGLKEKFNENNYSVAVTASTGNAAYLINGMTLHRFAGTGIEESNTDAMIRKARAKTSARNWLRTSVLIIDEVSMLSATLFDNLSKVAQAIRKNDEPFGGIRVLLFGDFLQLPPVSRNRNRIQRIFESNSWKELDIMTMELRTIMRQRDREFAHILDSMRLGICRDYEESYIQSLDRPIEHDDDIEPVRLYAKRDNVSRYNDQKLSQLDSPAVTFHAEDVGNESSLNQCPAEKVLTLKTRAQVMLIRNLTNQLINGSTGIIDRFETDPKTGIQFPIVSMLMKDKSVRQVKIDQVEWETKTPEGTIISSRKQLPLILAWSITIHRSQGRSIPRLFVDMDGIFERGQAYVALSRCTDPSGLQVSHFHRNYVMVDTPCVNFYCYIRAIENRLSTSIDQNREQPPEYTEGNDPPEYVPENQATRVAEDNEPRWGNNSADTLMMLGQLSIQESPQETSQASS